jgi:hypothetical protein
MVVFGVVCRCRNLMDSELLLCLDVKPSSVRTCIEDEPSEVLQPSPVAQPAAAACPLASQPRSGQKNRYTKTGFWLTHLTTNTSVMHFNAPFLPQHHHPTYFLLQPYTKMGIHHHSTPKKCRVVGTIDFLRSTGSLGRGRLFIKEQVF